MRTIMKDLPKLSTTDAGDANSVRLEKLKNVWLMN
jgi:hypothetical protein